MAYSLKLRGFRFFQVHGRRPSLAILVSSNDMRKHLEAEAEAECMSTSVCIIQEVKIKEFSIAPWVSHDYCYSHRAPVTKLYDNQCRPQGIINRYGCFGARPRPSEKTQ